jgi:hypothetical protein
MIYQKYNFVDTFSNADGSSKNNIVLGELGKIIRTQPSAVISALQDAGIRVPRKPSKKDLVRLIVRNKRNRRLSENLAILITLNAQNMNFLNANGDDPLAPLPTLSGSAGLQGIAQGTQTLQGTEKGNWFKGIGDFFAKRNAEKAGQTKSDSTTPSGWNKFKDWFTKNRETIGQVGTSVYNSLQTGGQINTGIGNDTNNNNNLNAEPTWFERNKTIAVIGAIAIVGGIIYFTQKGGFGGKKSKK